MKKYEIVAMGEAELRKEVASIKRKMANMTFDKKLEPLQNPMIFKAMRKDVARMLTRLNQIKQEKKQA